MRLYLAQLVHPIDRLAEMLKYGILELYGVQELGSSPGI